MIRAVVFDAVGTLIVPDPAVALVYADVGRRHGSRYRAEELRPRFFEAFDLQEALDREAGWATDEARERERWRAIVAQVIDDSRDPAACFAELYEHFSRPTSWRCIAGVGDVLAELRRRGMTTAIASNFDHRLPPIVAGLPELADIERIFVSSALGWRKPAGGFFNAVAAGLDVAPGEILFVGDDPTNDYDGATAAGMRVVLFDPAGRHGDLPHVRHLSEVESSV
jgi:putative hydrolase of the HAD superfamily